jgi:Rv0078B-related antitoxin
MEAVHRYPLEVIDEMFALGVEMRRERARRENPDLDEADIEAIVDAWLTARPADFGHGVLTLGTWPRR